MGLQFERPLLLLILVPCLALVYVLWRSSHAYLPPVRRAMALGLRSAIVTLLVLSLAGPLIQLGARQLAVAILLDRSDSITPAAQAQEQDWLARALTSKASDDQVAVVTFAGEAQVERPLSAETSLPTFALPDSLHPARTDIAEAIRMGLGALPSGMARRLVLLSDGQENQDQASAAAALAAAAGVQLFAVPAAQTRGPEALVQGLDAPGQIRQGDRFSATAEIQASDPTPATLHLLVDGQLAATQEVNLDAGVNRFVMPLEPQSVGHHVLRLQLEADADTITENNSGGAYVVVTGPARVLVVQASPADGQFLADALRAQGLQVDVTDPQSAPLDAQSLRDYAAVLLADVPASALAASQMTALQAYVQSYGGGLVVSGGDQAFGPGGYARTPLEEMLPVQMGLRGKSVSASTALILVIDNSGSMGQDAAGSNKMELAKQAAMAAAQSLGEYDQIGVVAFEDTPRWVIEPTSASDLNAVNQAISTMQPGGGTEIYPALKAAYDGLVPVSATVKHIVLLTDGEAPPGPYDQLTQQMKDAGITLSTIGIGSDADTNLLQQLAQMGNGGYYDGNDPFDLPQLVLKDAQQVQRAAIVEQDVQPRPVSDTPALAGIDTSSLPQLRGYVATTAKPQASVALVSGQLDPLLSEWQYGLGRVIAWTSDANNKWSSRWVEWPGFAQFWTQVVERAARPPDDPNRQVNITIQGSQAQITLDAQTPADDPQRHYLNFLPTTATLVDPRGQQQQIPLPQIAPGRYSATTPVEDDGVYQLDVQQTDPATGDIARQSSGFVVPYSPEYSAAATDETALESLARATGGQLITDPEQAFVHDLPAVGAPRPLWPYLMTLIAVLLVLDVAVRRVRFGAREMHGAYARVRRSLGYVDERRASGPVPAVAARATALGHAASAAAPGGSVKSRAAPRVGATPTMPEVSRSSRLIAARQRAVRR